MSSSDSDLNNIPCGYDTDAGYVGCGLAFPFSELQAQELCRKCTIVERATSDSERNTVKVRLPFLFALSLKSMI